jgi:hypothetical protein
MEKGGVHGVVVKEDVEEVEIPMFQLRLFKIIVRVLHMAFSAYHLGFGSCCHGKNVSVR